MGMISSVAGGRTSRRRFARSVGVQDMAIDLGTAITLVYVGNRGIVVSEPSVVASDSTTGLVHAVGVDAYEMDEAIAHYIRTVHQLAIGSRTAETIKLTIGSAVPLPEEETMEVRGRHLVTGLPTAIPLSSAEVREAIQIPLREIM